MKSVTLPISILSIKFPTAPPNISENDIISSLEFDFFMKYIINIMATIVIEMKIILFVIVFPNEKLKAAPVFWTQVIQINFLVILITSPTAM